MAETEIHLTEILKNAPKGTKLYSPLCGECELDSVDAVYIFVTNYGTRRKFFNSGRYIAGGECMLFPSKDNRDWSTFEIDGCFKEGDYIKMKGSNDVFKIIKQDNNYATLIKVIADSPEEERCVCVDFLDKYEKVEKFDPLWLNPFDRVLVRDDEPSVWECAIFSNLTDNENYPYKTTGEFVFKYCIPFNKETKHLINTSEDEPDFYKKNEQP